MTDMWKHSQEKKTSVTDRMTEWQTDGRTDRQTECKPIVPSGFTGGGLIITESCQLSHKPWNVTCWELACLTVLLTIQAKSECHNVTSYSVTSFWNLGYVILRSLFTLWNIKKITRCICKTQMHPATTDHYQDNKFQVIYPGDIWKGCLFVEYASQIRSLYNF